MPTPLPAAAAKSKRIESVDLLRGVVMLIMALDHVRDYFHNDAFLFNPTDLTQTSTALFFTRWITHFCAPVFTFLAGTAACISRSKKSRKELSFFLFTRGLWLVLVEILVITPGWTFNPYAVLILQVIWSIGISMVCLSVLIYLPKRLILGIGIVLIAAHNLLDNVHVAGNGLPSFLWSFLHEQRFFAAGHLGIFLGYPILPWIGIMATGYCLGGLYAADYDAVKRKKILIYLGLGAIALFILIRAINVYGDPSSWAVQKTPVFTFLSFLNTTKYPPSLLYTLMTIGPAFLFLAFTEKPLNAITAKIAVFGRVPMFYYIVHIYLIHLLAIGAAVINGHKWSDMILTTWVSMSPQLKGYGFSLPVVYIIWIILLIGLYPLCKWYDAYKRNHREKWWLSYL